jgi:rod shape-determining protein MreC
MDGAGCPARDGDARRSKPFDTKPLSVRSPTFVRRTVLAALVVVAFALLTISARQGDSGPLADGQRAVGASLAPVSLALSRVARPFHDAADWVRESADAQSQRDRLERQNRQLLAELGTKTLNARENAELLASLNYTRSRSFQALGSYRPVAARVISHSDDLFQRKVWIDQGSSSGIRVNDPVVAGVSPSVVAAGASLVGKVTNVLGAFSEVTLISDPSMAITAVIASRTNGATGSLVPTSGDPSTLELKGVGKGMDVRQYDLVTTAGFLDEQLHLRSLYPRGIPIGAVTAVSTTDTQLNKSIQVTPYVDLSSFGTCLVLTNGVPAVRPSSGTSTAGTSGATSTTSGRATTTGGGTR